MLKIEELKKMYKSLRGSGIDWWGAILIIILGPILGLIDNIRSKIDVFKKSK